MAFKLFQNIFSELIHEACGTTDECSFDNVLGLTAVPSDIETELPLTEQCQESNPESHMWAYPTAQEKESL